MHQSVQPSFTIDSVLANLSESTEIDCSDDGIQFSEMVQKYQDETQAIQSILNSLYQQIDKSITPPNQKNSQLDNKNQSCSAIKDIQERLISLEKENEELTAQIKRFANISEVSSFQTNSSKKINPSIHNSEINTITFSDNKFQSENMNLSKKSYRNDSYWETKYNEQVALNMQLTADLSREKEMNQSLKRQQKSILSRLLTMTNFSEFKESDDFSQIEKALSYLSNYFITCSSQKKLVHQLLHEISNEKQKIDKTLNSFKNEMQNFKFLTMHQLQNQQKTNPSFKSVNIKTTAETIQKNASKFTINHTQSSTNNESSMVVRGCEELIDSITTNFNGIQKISINELVDNPREFGRYINLVRSHLSTNVQSLKKENNELARNLSSANNRIKTAVVSPEIQSTVNNVMSLISKVTEEMKNEHKELLAQLS